MTIQCPACLSDNPTNNNYCVTCGYEINQNQQKNNTNITNISTYHLPLNTTLKNGYYLIEKVLGEGGFGITYQGKLTNKNMSVAIKELWPEKAARQGNQIIWPSFITPKEKKELINKFNLEAQNQKKCNHPNIPKLYDFFTENNTAYIIMEYVEGKTLFSLLKSQGKFTENQLIPLILQVLEALKTIHHNNFLHRDIKPDNLILDEKKGKLLLIDFGSTKEFIAGKTGDMTRVLTPGYAPAEQYTYRSKTFVATDIYALCASIYELLTGQLPIESLARLDAISHNQPDPLISPRQIVPEISQKMERIIMTGMEIKVENRWQNIDELLTVLNGKYTSPLQTRAQQLVKENKLNDAINMYKKCLEQEPENDKVAVELALLQIHINPKEAEKTAEIVIQLNPQEPRAYGILGLIKCRQGYNQIAINLFHKAVKLAPKESWLQANLAWSLAKNNQWTEAENTVNKALQLNNNCAFSLGLKAWININKKEYKQVIKFATQAIFKNKNNQDKNSQELKKWVYPYLIFALEQALMTKDATDTERRIEEFIKEVPNNGYSWGLKAWQQAKNGFWNEAIFSFEKCLQCNNVSQDILLNYAITLEHLNKIPEALTIYQEINHKFPENPLVLFRLGTLSAEKNQKNDTKLYLQKALKIKSNYAEVYHNLGWVMLQEKNYSQGQEIINNYRQAIKYYQENNNHYYADKIKKIFQNMGITL